MIAASLLSLVALACFVTLATGLGMRMLRFLAIDSLNLNEQAIFALALGLGVFAYAVFGLGSVGLLSPVLVWLLLVAAIAFSWRECGALIRLLQSLIQELPTRLRSARPWQVGAISLLSLLAVMSLIGALAPPTMMDSLRYLGAVREYVDRGRIEFIPVFWWNYPALYEMLFTGALLLHIEALPALLHWMAGVTTLLSLFLLGKRLHSTSAGVMAMLIYYTMPIVTDRSTSPKHELALAMFGLLSIYALILWMQHERSGWMVVSAIMAGLQASTKLQGSGSMVASGIAAVIAIVFVKRRSPGEAVRLVMQYALLAGFVGCPWYVRNWLASGDPLWPVGYGIFHGRFWTETNYLKFSAWQRGVGDGIWHYITGFWSVTQKYAAFGDIRVATSPLVLIFVPGLVLVWRYAKRYMREATLICLVYVWAYYSIWFTFYQQSAYLIAIWPELALLSGITAVLLSQFGHIARAAVRYVSLLYMPIGVGTAIVFNAQFVPVVFGSQTRNEFLAERVYYFDDIQWLNDNLSDDSKLLYMPLQAFYYLNRDYLIAHANYQGFFDYESYSSGIGLLEDLCARGVTHIFWTSGEPEQPAALIAQLNDDGWLQEIYRNENAREILSRTFSLERISTVAIYQIKYAPSVCGGDPGD